MPAGTPPGPYAVELVVYDPVTGLPWPSQAGDLALTPNGLRLGEVTVVRPHPSPPMQPTLATFGPLALIEAKSPATTVAPGGQVPVELLWQAAEAPGEPLVVVTQLQDAAGRVVAGQEAQPLDGRYPTQNWAAGELRPRPALPCVARRPHVGRISAERGRVPCSRRDALGDEGRTVWDERPFGCDNGGREIAAIKPIQKERHLASTHF